MNRIEMGDHFILEGKTAIATECLCDCMNLPTNVVITGCDSMSILSKLSTPPALFSRWTICILPLSCKNLQARDAGQFELYFARNPDFYPFNMA